MAAAAAERQFAIIVKVDTHIRNTDLSVVYTNDPFVVENSINTLEQLVAEDDKYKVVGFDLEYTGGRVGHDRKVVVTLLCVRHHVLIYHYCLVTRPCERFAGFVNSPEYRFVTVDTTNDLKVLKTSGLSCQKLVNIQGQYKVWGGEKKKRKDSLVDLTMTIIDPYYRDMKVECDKDKSVWHKSWVNELYEDHIKYAAKDVYTSYKMYWRIVDMRKCLLPADSEG